MLVESVLLYILGVLIIVVGLVVSIGLHEVGHLVPAKLFGVRVTQYMIGFGKTIWSTRKGETEYGVKMIPLGGYISMIGMFPPTAPGERATESTTGFIQQLATSKEPARRARYFDTLVQDAREASAETIGAGDEDRTFYRLPVWKRIVVMLGGPFMNLILSVVLFAVLLMGIGTAQSTTTIGAVSECALPSTAERTTCESGDATAPGAAAGIEPGDRLVSIDGTAISSWEESTAIIRESAGKTLSLVVERDGEDVTLSLTPLLTERYVYDENGQEIEKDGEPVVEAVGFVGISPTSELVQQPVTAVLPAVGEAVGGVVNVILNLPQRLVDTAVAAFGPGERDPDGPMSVVGVGRIAGEVAALDEVPIASKASAMLGILASLNAMLFVFNLVPLLPLDGGHILTALFEAVRRGFAKLRRKPDPGPVDSAKLMPLTFGVVIVLGAMSLLLIYADIVKPINLFG
ncbi:membrane-associated protease RseP (regulator of RpoE activity) [Labedella gwakjiensis]|uniref:Membrane-associated protease RseP (Regulator of RpoE activity) n=1 Tax=Labedella gwakjiensis TaxID=390269 RepID=A0A2P8GYE4_9MICO|nr:membrane-associated protease RseP (regulator of RpoE activity) [Labedella gwakjiensis]